MPFPQGHALLIGVGTHQYDPRLDVPITVADAEAVASVLRAANHCGYPAEQVRLIARGGATKAGILAALDDLAKRTTVRDTVFLFYCGHGALGSDGNYYLVSHDAQVQHGRVVASTGVSEAELLQKLRAIRAKRMLLIFNACHSGNISPTLAVESPVLGASNPAGDTASALLGTGQGRIIIVACREEELSYIGDGKLTLFTQALVDGLTGKGVRNSSGYISAFSLYEYLFETVSEFVNSTYHAIQQPELTVLRGVGPFAVALYRGASTLGDFASDEALPEGMAVRTVTPQQSERRLQQRIHIHTGGGDYVGGNVNTGGGDFIGRDKNIFQSFREAPRSLASYIRIDDFQTLVDGHTRNFVGREFVFQSINEILNDPKFPSGYILIRGEPGIGKTALIAQLVKQKDYVHHFNIASQNIRSIQDFLANICAQIIVRYGLVENHPTLRPEATKDSGFLAKLLAETVAKHQEQPVVILVDALDEAKDLGLSPNANRLYLPSGLPNGVFFIVTSREKDDERLLVDQRRDIYLRDDDPRNLEDVRHYIENFIHKYHTDMTPRITQWKVDEDRFVSVITQKSQGNFMYLVYVLGDIRDGKLTPTNISNIYNLPTGLLEYYQRHWRMMQDQNKETFEQYYKPVVCQLAVVRQPVSVAQLIEWTGLTEIEIKKVISVWREFLNENQGEQGKLLYSVYHTSFQDFLRDYVGLKPYHRNINDTALNKIKQASSRLKR